MPCPVPSLGIRRGLRFGAAVALDYQRTQRDSTNQNREFHADLYSIGVRYAF